MFYINKNHTWDLMARLSPISNENIEVLTIVLHRQFMKEECISVIYIPPRGDQRLAIEKLDELADAVLSHGLLGGILILIPAKQIVWKQLDNFTHKNALIELIKSLTRIFKNADAKKKQIRSFKMMTFLNSRSLEIKPEGKLYQRKETL